MPANGITQCGIHFGCAQKRVKLSACDTPGSAAIFMLFGHRFHLSILLALLATVAFPAHAATYTQGNRTWTYEPVRWERFVPVEGQELPVPEQWLQDEEARIAHSLKLPDSVPKSMPFDFDKAWWRSWLPGKQRVAVQYFFHLCDTEAGEWIFKTVRDVEGLFFARPQGGYPDGGLMTDAHGPEAPWIQRILWLTSDRPHEQGAWFVYPPLRNYRFVEQPHRNVNWQADIREPYVRLFGYTQVPVLDQNGKQTEYLKEGTPMQVIGIPILSARHGYTWRGLRRERDREFGIAGGEVLIYDLQTLEVLAVRRQFLIASKNPRGEGKAMWEVAARCAKPKGDRLGGEFEQFALDVLQTIEPSTTGTKKP